MLMSFDKVKKDEPSQVDLVREWSTPKSSTAEAPVIEAPPAILRCAVKYQKAGKIEYLKPGELIPTTVVNFNRCMREGKCKHTRLGRRTKIIAEIDDQRGRSISLEFCRPGFLPDVHTAECTVIYEKDEVVLMGVYSPFQKALLFRARWYFVPSVRSLAILKSELMEKDLPTFRMISEEGPESDVFALSLSDTACVLGSRGSALIAKMKRFKLCGLLGLGVPKVVVRPKQS